MVPAEGSLPDMLAKARSKADARGLSEVEIVANIYEVLGCRMGPRQGRQRCPLFFKRIGTARGNPCPG